MYSNAFLFYLFLWHTLYQLWFHVCVPCSIYGLSVPNCCYCSILLVCAPYILRGIFVLIVLRISVDSLSMSYGKCHFCLIYLFATVVLLCFVMFFVFEILFLFVFI
jgi:hypothetical protein